MKLDANVSDAHIHNTLCAVRGLGRIVVFVSGSRQVPSYALVHFHKQYIIVEENLLKLDNDTGILNNGA